MHRFGITKLELFITLSVFVLVNTAIGLHLYSQQTTTPDPPPCTLDEPLTAAEFLYHLEEAERRSALPR